MDAEGVTPPTDEDAQTDGLDRTAEVPPRAVPEGPSREESLPPRQDSIARGVRPTTEPPKPQGVLRRMWTGLLAFIAATWKFIYPIFKLAKGGKILLTMGSMLLSVWFYSMMFGWKFALGFVICIFVHEMGHVTAAWRLGKTVSAPIFIPGMGALILSKSYESAWEGAIIGIGGPLFGTGAAVACWGYYSLTGNPLYLGLALTGFFLNLFNMIPMFPLDGGWITGAISPYIWVIGLVVMLGLALSGYVRNPFIFILLIMSLPRIVSAFKTGKMNPGDRTSPAQRLTMGLAYVGLSGFLVWGVAATSQTAHEFQQSREQRPNQVAMLP